MSQSRQKGSGEDNFCFPCISYRKNATIVKHFFRLNYGNAANQNMLTNKLGTLADRWLWVSGVTIPTEGSRGITPVFHAFRIGKKASGKNETNVFRLNYDNAANQNMFAYKVDTYGI